ncbi:hypothetical protein [Maribacter sp. ACAM166]|uniref:hypothetical protein n=1 Tax=Maribacter sp. ACAM166 TaxID=2508996 RepID=UPI0010FF6275|nr:hypothetical protein [Maribacter sp. ACAM166]TLP81342.1 hypothetical protein ES765_04870 [Maribacter sp. ACAM166]
MATPTVLEIKNQIIAKKAEFTALDGLETTSKVGIYNLWAYVVAFSIWLQYGFFETYKAETDDKIRTQKVYTILWFRDKALQYRHGHALVKEGYNLEYTGDGYTESEIEAALVVKRAAVVEKEVTNQTFLFVKCATEVNGKLAILPAEQKQGIVDYFKRIKPAGTKLEVFSDNADELRIEIDFFYDPSILTENGSRIDGTNNTPVQAALRNYLENLRFNGEFSVAELEDILQAISGCSDREAYIKNPAYNFQDPANWLDIENTVVANSGYMEIEDANLIINFIPKTVAT